MDGSGVLACAVCGSRTNYRKDTAKGRVPVCPDHLDYEPPEETGLDWSVAGLFDLVMAVGRLRRDRPAPTGVPWWVSWDGVGDGSTVCFGCEAYTYSVSKAKGWECQHEPDCPAMAIEAAWKKMGGG